MRVFTYGKGIQRMTVIKPQTEAEVQELARMSLWKQFLFLLRWRQEGKVIQRVATVEDIPERLVL